MKIKVFKQISKKDMLNFPGNGKKKKFPLLLSCLCIFCLYQLILKDNDLVSFTLNISGFVGFITLLYQNYQNHKKCKFP